MELTELQDTIAVYTIIGAMLYMVAFTVGSILIKIYHYYKADDKPVFKEDGTYLVVGVAVPISAAGVLIGLMVFWKVIIPMAIIWAGIEYGHRKNAEKNGRVDKAVDILAGDEGWYDD